MMTPATTAVTFPIRTSGQKSQVAAAATLIFVSTVAVIIRVIARRKSKNRLTSSDYTVLASLFCNWILCGQAIAGVVHGGIGVHQDQVPPPNLKIMSAILYAFQLQWAAAEVLVKTSMCLFYMEIFQMRNFRKWSYIVIANCVVFALFVILVTTFICWPVKMNVDPTVPGHCGNRNAMWIVIGALNVVTDIMVLVLPMPHLWGLQIPLKKKIALIIIFSIGGFVCIISLIRLHFLLLIDTIHDITGTIPAGFIWSMMEPSLAITIGSFPTYGPLFKGRRFSSIWRSERAEHSGTHSSSQFFTADGPGTRKFHRIDGADNMAIPLTQQSTTVHAVPKGDQRSSRKPAHDEDSLDSNEAGIEVVREWEVKRY